MGSLRNKPIFLFLLPLFFVLHGFTENYYSVPLKDALVLTLLYIAIALIIACLCWLYFRSITKAALMAFLLLGYNFIFGSVRDMLSKHFGKTFLWHYSFILPASFLFFLAIFIWLKKRKTPLTKLLSYLNLLFALLVVIDTIWLGSKMITTTHASAGISKEVHIINDTCNKPDIYFIILDAYSGNTALKEKFNFDNSEFENELQNRGFYVFNNSRSNYNYTPYSIASILNMDYLNLDMKTKNQGNLNYCYRMISNSRVTEFLEANKYTLYNYSIFDFPGQPSVNSDNFLPTRTKLITEQTFVSRIWNDILSNAASGKLPIHAIEKKYVYSHFYNNENAIRLTLEKAAQKTTTPKFVYTHLMMPHHPYYFDSMGKALPFDSLVEGKQMNKHNYVEYLQYCNKRILLLLENILKTSPSPPVVVVAGDHGFRYFIDKEDHKYCFMNLAAVYLPGKDYRNFNSNLSSVNLFPIVFNSLFQQHFPLRKDSTIYLWE